VYVYIYILALDAHLKDRTRAFLFKKHNVVLIASPCLLGRRLAWGVRGHHTILLLASSGRAEMMAWLGGRRPIRLVLTSSVFPFGGLVSPSPIHRAYSLCLLTVPINCAYSLPTHCCRFCFSLLFVFSTVDRAGI
jgi:hypothetical protein